MVIFNMFTVFFRLNCPEISDDDTKLMDDMAYWLEGILQTGIKEIRYFHYQLNIPINLFDLVFDTTIFLFSVVAFGGIFGNVASCYILSRREMRNSFNLLLVMLSVYDTFYLLFAVLDSCRKFFEVVIQKEKQIYFHLCKHIKNITLMIDAFNLKCRLKDKQLCK